MAIIYQNRHWVVDRDGMLSLQLPDYHVAFESIFDLDRAEGRFFDWPLHIADKDWANIYTFNDAFCTAIRHYAQLKGRKLDEDLLRESCLEGERIYEERIRRERDQSRSRYRH